jgi:hypothetical protein
MSMFLQIFHNHKRRCGVNSITKIKEEHYKNYFIYTYNKDNNINNKKTSKCSKTRKSKTYKNN